ncbi:ATP-dependent DNA helicase RecG [Enemella evansiae]|uniref:ATP-dependent DNA helicase RecG n=1 Tax=Enemella evansiae TaxID=2016499 RepID=UPI0010605446|nr:ATP-dependent DNA helicase RecG [Enemella evansiae]TDO92607.1 ATP-dependent DNA helicase RecG [Enemella evansiae]
MWQTPAYRVQATRLETVLGDKTAKAFEQLKVRTVGDALRHVPRRYLRGAESTSLRDLKVGEDAAFISRVIKSETKGNQRSLRLEVIVGDGTGTLRLTFFGRRHLIDFWQRTLPEGARGLFAGKIGVFNGQLQLTHPDFVTLDEAGHITGGAQRNQQMGELASRVGGLIGIYPATAKLPTWTIAQCIDLVREQTGELPEPLPATVREAVDLVALARADRAIDFEPAADERLPELAAAVQYVHRPDDLAQAWLGRQRFLFDEAFAVQAAMAYRRAAARSQPGTPRPRQRDGLLAAFDATLPFELTAGQQQVSEEIFTGLEQTHPMQRLLQGEVGSGKTLVALRAMLTVVDNGGQAVLLAPTEVLAQQHHQTISRMLGPLAEGEGGLFDAGVLGDGPRTKVVLLSGSMTAAQKKKALLQIASGEAGIVVGTHALLADRVQYADLGLVVVDEQHRFGVEQRAALNDRAEARPHVLVMTATPIPRTVAITVFGDLEVSTLTEIPAGRSEVSTQVVPENVRPEWVERAWQRITEEVAAGRQAFVVCPQISAGEKNSELVPQDPSLEGKDAPAPRNVTDLYAELTGPGGPLESLRVAALHGKLSADEKDRVMAAFAAGELDVLVSTTVVEVGVDVPNASVMVICDADRFGISQLHQLRGRIGRGEHPGLCLLLTRTPGDSPAAERLRAVAGTRDGFQLAEVDLAQRREGDVLGASQAGARSSLKLLRVLDHVQLLEQARAIAEDCVARDPELTDPGVADAVAQVEEQAAAEWLERT